MKTITIEATLTADDDVDDDDIESALGFADGVISAQIDYFHEDTWPLFEIRCQAIGCQNVLDPETDGSPIENYYDAAQYIAHHPEEGWEIGARGVARDKIYCPEHAYNRDGI